MVKRFFIIWNMNEYLCVTDIIQQCALISLSKIKYKIFAFSRMPLWHSIFIYNIGKWTVAYNNWLKHEHKVIESISCYVNQCDNFIYVDPVVLCFWVYPDKLTQNVIILKIYSARIL